MKLKTNSVIKKKNNNKNFNNEQNSKNMIYGYI